MSSHEPIAARPDPTNILAPESNSQAAISRLYWLWISAVTYWGAMI